MFANNTFPRSELAHFLKFLRERIDPAAPYLGPCRRHPSRIGKRVTQAEFSEAIGVTREWYAALESARLPAAPKRRPSQALLERVAGALMLTREERTTLFHLAVPEEWRVRVRPDSHAVLDAFSRLRSSSKRLLTATTVEETLALASERIADWFGRPLYVHTVRRRDCGLWEAQPLDGQQEQCTLSRLIRDLEQERLSPEAIDAAYLYHQLPHAGDVGTEELYPRLVKREVAKACTRLKFAGFTFLKARVRSRTGIICTVSVIHEVGHSYSAQDRAALGALAEIASLALS